MLVVSDRLTELFASLNVLGGHLDTSSSTTKRATRDIESTAIESLKCNLESLSLFADQVFFGYFDIIERHNSCGLHVPSHLMFVGTER